MTSDPPDGPRRDSPAIIAAMLAGILVRVAAMAPASGRFDDPDNYLPLARSLAEGRGLVVNGRPTAYRPPLYPIVLAPLVRLPGARASLAVALLHLAFGAGTVGLTAVAARRWGLGRGQVAVAAGVVALDPVLAWQCRFVMTETLAAFLVTATLAALARGDGRGCALGGVLAGLAGLARPSLLPSAALAALAAGLIGPWTWRERLRYASVMASGTILILLPWAVRNAVVLGAPVWTTTHGGYTLALANNEVYYRDVLNGPPGRVWTGRDQWLWWDSVNRATAGMSEPEADRFLRAAAMRLALDRPADFARACLDRLGRFWGVAPATAVYGPKVRWATALWTVPLWVLLAMGLLRGASWRWPRIAAPLAVLGLSLVHALYWTDLRMRAPVVPAIALLAASAGVRRPRPARAGTNPTGDPRRPQASTTALGGG